MANIHCKNCDAFVPIKLKLAAEDYLDEHKMELDNMQGGTQSDKSYRPMDSLDHKILYFDKGTKKIKPRLDLDRPHDDMQPTQSVAEKIGNFLLVKCGNCGRIYAEIWDPSSTDVYHYDSGKSHPETEVTTDRNEIGPDYYKVKATSPDVNLDKIVQKIKKKYKKNSEEGYEEKK